MKKFYPIIFFAAFAIVSFVMSITLNRPSEASQYVTLDSETQKIIQDDHVRVAAIINYLLDLQKKGVLPVQEEPKK